MTPDPLVDTPAFHEAVKLAQVASRVEDFSLTQPEVEDVLTAALPAIRKGLAEEIRAMPIDGDVSRLPERRIVDGVLLAANYLVRTEETRR